MRLDRIAAALSAAAAGHIPAPPQDLPPRPAADLESPNGALSFPKDRDRASPPPPLQSWRRPLRLALLALCLFSFLLLAAYLALSYLRPAYNYYVVLDCGSTGTRAYVYRWSLNRKRGGKGGGALPITLRSLPDGGKWKLLGKSGRAYSRMETEPGLDKLVRNETGLRAALAPLLLWAGKQIPKRSRAGASVFLYATAGVRRLPRADSDWLLDKAWLLLKGSGFLCRREWVKTISGMEEAYYGWIALNHHMGVLGAPAAKGTFGSLDLGGSSLQVTFEDEDAMRHETGLKLSIGPVNHHLSAYSLPGYGLNDAFDRSVVRLLRASPSRGDGSAVIRHPCLHSGYRERYACSRCGGFKQDGSPAAGGRSGRRHRVGVPVKLVGDPDWEKCSSLAKAVVNRSEWTVRKVAMDCDIQPCALSDKLPRPHGRFFAMSGFFVVFKFFNLSSDSTIEDMVHKGHEFCSKNWEAAKNSVVPQPFIEQYCFRAPYVASLLRDGLHIGDTKVVIGSGGITWTLGVALLEAGQASSSRMDLSAYNFLQPRKMEYTIMLLIIALLLLCLCACNGKWRSRFLRRSPIPILRPNGMLPFIGSHRWNPISSGDDRVKLPSSPKISGSQSRYGMRGSSVHLAESSLHVSASGLSRSYSGGLGQTHIENTVGTFWPPHRNQMKISSRRSLSREDLSSPQSEVHLVKS